MSQASGFYVAVAEVTAAVVGLLGGFLMQRVLSYVHEWQALRRQLEASQASWLRRKEEVGRATDRSGEARRRSQSDVDWLWQELLEALEEKSGAAIPSELKLGAAILGLLFCLGTAAPLLLLGAPTNGAQLIFVIVGISLLASFVWLIARLAAQTLKRVKDFKLSRDASERYRQFIEAKQQWE
jgi:hypothetical protein